MRCRQRKKGAAIQIVLLVSLLLVGVVPFIASATSPTLVKVDPLSKTVSAGQLFTLDVLCTPGQLVKAYELKISFNPSLLQANSVSEGTIFHGYTTYFNAGTIDNTAGTIVTIYGLVLGSGGTSSPGTLLTVSFTARSASGTSSVSLSNVGVANLTSYVPVTITNGTVTLREFTLSVSVDGSGSVTKNPNHSTYAYGDVVTLTAVPGTGSLFSSWSGDLSGSQNPKTITMTANKTVVAHFTDSVAPQITDLTRSTSSPLDTDPSYGWVNVSCTVTDNTGVSMVNVKIHNPDGSWSNLSMSSRTAGKYYYRSATVFSSVGNYSYYIWAKDANNNANSSGNVLFSMPPNWDVCVDGRGTVLDLTSISNHYGQSSSNGWIREDVDNNGVINVLDLMLMSNHYGGNMVGLRDSQFIIRMKSVHDDIFSLKTYIEKYICGYLFQNLRENIITGDVRPEGCFPD